MLNAFDERAAGVLHTISIPFSQFVGMIKIENRDISILKDHSPSLHLKKS